MIQSTSTLVCRRFGVLYALVIAPNVRGIAATDFESKPRAILEGERAALAAVPQIKAVVAAKTK